MLQVADYPFTTLVPNLGVCGAPDACWGGVKLLPGVLEGAHAGVGLGHEFLRHCQRTRALVHVIDGTSPDPLGDYRAIRAELALFNPGLASKPQVAVKLLTGCICFLPDLLTSLVLQYPPSWLLFMSMRAPLQLASASTATRVPCMHALSGCTSQGSEESADTAVLLYMSYLSRHTLPMPARAGGRLQQGRPAGQRRLRGGSRAAAGG